jgi:molybdopterin-guanine dinucleotide biosynthesis protein A
MAVRMDRTEAISQEPAAAIILAGGQSSRLGFDKRTLTVGGVPIVAHLCGALRPFFEQIIIGANSLSPCACADAGAELVADRRPDEGPMMAIASCLARSRHELNFVIACDVPRPPLHVVRALLDEARGRDGAVPVTSTGRWEPLFAVYRRDLRGEMDALLDSGERSLLPLIESGDFSRVELARFGLEAIPNINTTDDLQRHRGLF